MLARSRQSARSSSQGQTQRQQSASAGRGNAAAASELQSETTSETSTLDQFEASGGQAADDPGGQSAGDPDEAAARVGAAARLTGGGGADLGTLMVGSTVVARAAATAALTEADGFWFRCVGASNGVSLEISARNVDVEIVATEVEVEGVRVMVSAECGQPVPAQAAAAAQASGPGGSGGQDQAEGAQAASAGSSRRHNDAEDTPWYVLVPIVNLVGIWFWRPVRRASRHAAEQSMEEMRLHFAELVAGIFVPIVCGFEIAINPTGVFGAVHSKVDCLQALGQARTQEEKWQVLNRYASQAIARMAIGRLTSGVGGSVRGSLSSLGLGRFIAQNAGYIRNQLIISWLSSRAEEAVGAIFGGPHSTWQQVTDGAGQDLLKTVISTAIGAEIGESEFREAMEVLANALEGTSQEAARGDGGE